MNAPFNPIARIDELTYEPFKYGQHYVSLDARIGGPRSLEIVRLIACPVRVNISFTKPVLQGLPTRFDHVPEGGGNMQRRVCRISMVGLVMAPVVAMTGCTTAPTGPAWGSQVSFAPGWSRIGSAARDAAVSPVTWAPVAAAGLLQIGHADRHLSHSLSDHNPVFGSRDSAKTASDALLGASIALYGVTALAAPSYEDGWYANKAQGLAVGAGAAIATEGVVEGLKSATGRERPDDSGNDSFPSGHAALSTLAATMTQQTVDTLPISDGSQFALKSAAVGLSLGTDYARVEARKHYPSDVLVGAALGHFVGVFADEAFLGVSPDRFVPSVTVSHHGATLGFQSYF